MDPKNTQVCVDHQCLPSSQVSSRDGYCSLTTFAAGELGAPAPAEAVPAHIARRLAVATKSVKPRWAQNT